MRRSPHPRRFQNFAIPDSLISPWRTDEIAVLRLRHARTPSELPSFGVGTSDGDSPESVTALVPATC